MEQRGDYKAGEISVICVFDLFYEHFHENGYGTFGTAVLHPSKCEAEEEAGGVYEITMEHPITKDGPWGFLVCGAIIKAPVPVPTIQNAYVGQEVDVYGILSDGTALREGPSEPSQITYDAWESGTSYAVGARVTSSGQNYQLNAPLTGNEIYADPGSLLSKWSKIANWTGGSPVMMTLSEGTEVYYVEESSTEGWSEISTKQGINGYLKDSQMEFLRHETVQPVPERTVEDQLFRIYNTEIRTEQHVVIVHARHVSYDLTGALIGECNISLAEPAVAIMRIKDALLTDYRGEIATNLTQEDNGTYTGNLSYKNGIYAFLDPDNGLIPYFKAQLIRDNWDLFIMKNDVKDRGIRLAYGVNLRGVTWKRRSDAMINRIMPVAKNENGTDFFLDDLYVDSPTLSLWPVVLMERLQVNGQVGKDDGTGTETVWTEETLQEEMETKANERFSLDKVDSIKVEVNVDFTLLGDTEEYKQYRGLEKLYMYDMIHVTDETIGMDLELQVKKIVYDCILKRYKSITIGNEYDYGDRSVFGYNIGNGAINYEKISPEAVKRIIGEVE